MEELVKNVRYAVRSLVANPGFALVAILTLGLGIGANAAIFSVISGVLLKPLPYEKGDDLVVIRQSTRIEGQEDPGIAVNEFYDYRDQSQDFSSLVEYHQMSFDLLERGEPDRVSTGVVSHDFFDTLGIKPILGRSFAAGDDLPGAEAVLILSNKYWRERFGGEAKIVGEVFQMNDRPHRVVGVLPDVPMYPNDNDVYMSVSACPFRARAESGRLQNRRAFAILNVFGRLKPGVSRKAADAGVGAICHRFAGDDRSVYPANAGFAVAAANIREELTRDARPMLLILLGTTGLILLLACANVANLTLARLLRRERELALRAALGADRGRLIRQLLTESSILSLAGGVVGIGFAWTTVGLLTDFVARFTARTGEVGIDWRVLAFTLVVSIGTGLLFGTVPALSSRADLANSMKQGSKGSGESPRRRKLQNALIVAQVAVSVVLLVGAGLLLTSFYRLQRTNAGYSPERVLSAEAFTNFSKYPNADAQIAFYSPLLERLQAAPGVVSAAITNAVPLSTSTPGQVSFDIEGQVEPDVNRKPTMDLRVASPLFFETLGIKRLAGRVFTDADDKRAPLVVVINQSMANRFWKGKDPVGSRITGDNGQTWATVVGVVGDVKQFGLERDAIAQVYEPLKQTASGLGGRILVRTVGEPAAATQAVRAAVRAVDPSMPIENVGTLEELRDKNLATPRLTAALLLVFAALALFVTMAGITGVIATSVSQRTQEFGMRMALGARRDAVLRMVVGQGLMLVGAGVAAGLVAAALATRVLSSYLYDTRATDPLTLAAVIAALFLCGIAACIGPAWRATTVDPMVALRSE